MFEEACQPQPCWPTLRLPMPIFSESHLGIFGRPTSWSQGFRVRLHNKPNAKTITKAIAYLIMNSSQIHRSKLRPLLLGLTALALTPDYLLRAQKHSSSRGAKKTGLGIDF